MSTILVIANCDVLAHASRALVVAQALRGRFAGTVACAGSGRYGALFTEAGFPFHELAGFDPDWRRELAERGMRVLLDPRWVREGLRYPRRMVESELELYRSLKPCLVVMDARATVQMSTEAFGVPCILIGNASQWFSAVKSVVSKHIRRIGVPWLERVLNGTFSVFAGAVTGLQLWVLRWFLNRLRRIYHLEPLKSMSDAFRKLRTIIFADLELMAPPEHLPFDNYHYVGPIVWQPSADIPQPAQDSRDIVYVSMGSTGDPEIFRLLVAALAEMPDVQAVIAVGDLVEPESLTPLPANVQVYRFLPGIEMAKRARLLICHGGLGTIYQALSQGVPILGIPFWAVFHEGPALDRVEALGVGKKLVDRRLTAGKIARTIREMLGNDGYRRAARDVAAQFRLEDGPQRSAAIILEEVEKGRAASHV